LIERTVRIPSPRTGELEQMSDNKTWFITLDEVDAGVA
jgi:hypothetical protein